MIPLLHPCNRPRLRACRRAFTLIELLIVVAIIAILAAIAVPNFLHAQLRAKISRVLADMRTVSTAVEAYAGDYGVYPPTQDRAYSLNAPAVVTSSIYCGYRLLPCTTPVAYIARLPMDPFSYVPGRIAGRSPGPNLAPDGSIVNPHLLPYTWRNTREVLVNGTVVPDSSYLYWQQVTGYPPYWYLASLGPDLDYRATLLDPSYDPSNGLISDGDIVMLGPSIGFVNKRLE